MSRQVGRTGKPECASATAGALFVCAVLLAVCLAGALSRAAQAGGAGPRALLLYDRSQLDLLRERVRQGLPDGLLPAVAAARWAGNQALALAPRSVVEKTVFPQGAGPHDYVSLSTYAWPDPAKPDGLPYVTRDGLVSPERAQGEEYDRERLSQMVGAVEKLSLAYHLTGEERYAEKAAVLLRTWFLAPETRMNPHLTFSQGIPGRATGRPSGVIDTVDLIPLLDGVALLEGSPAWTLEDVQGLKAWFSDYLDWLLTSKLGQAEAKATNNHGVWYDAQVAAFALYVGRKDLAARVVAEAGEKRVKTQVEPDGRMPRELARTRSLHYTLYTLEAFFTLCRAGDQVGVNLWDYRTADGRSLSGALGYVLPYLTGEKTWEYQRITDDNELSFAFYLAMAIRHYGGGEREYRVVTSLLGNDQSRRRIAAESFLRH